MFLCIIIFRENICKSSRSQYVLLQIFQNCQEKTGAEIGAPEHLSTTLLKLAKNLFLEPFFISLDKSILLHLKCLMSKFSGILETFPKLIPPYVWVSLFSPHLVFSDRKHFCSILTYMNNLSHRNHLSNLPFARLWFEEHPTKYFPKM